MGLRETLLGALYQIWPMGGVLSGSLLIAWATEVSAFFLSRGLAFALLAFLQVLPEFAVEAVITHQAGVSGGDIEKISLISANFTGANRLIVGLFLPLVFLVAAAKARGAGRALKTIDLPRASSVEVIVLAVATFYSFLIPMKGSLSVIDSVVLASLYGGYLWMVYRLPPAKEDAVSLPKIPRAIRMRPVNQQYLWIAFLFVLGGTLLFLSVHPFYENTLELAIILGVSSYFLFQWIAPLLSEFPELITILYWGKTGREQLGITNAVSSKVNQWTLLLAMVPLVYLYATYTTTGLQWSVPFAAVQRVEILLTAAQGLFAAICLMSLRFERWQALTLLGLWGSQLLDPVIDPWIRGWLGPLAVSPFGTGALLREWYIIVYIALSLFIVYRSRGQLPAFGAFREVWTNHIRPKRQTEDAGA